MIGFLTLGIGVWLWGFSWGLVASGFGVLIDIWIWRERRAPLRRANREEIDFYLLSYPLFLKMVCAGGGLAADQLQYLEFILNYGSLKRLEVRDVQKIRNRLLSLARDGTTFGEILRTLSQGNFREDQLQWLWSHASRIVHLKKVMSAETALYFEQFKEVFKITEDTTGAAPSVQLLDIYGILGCSAYSSDEEVKRSFRHLVKQFHPDRFPVDLEDKEVEAAVERFLNIFEAYDAIRRERNF